MFKLFDRDGGGSIDETELLSALVQLGEKPSAEDVRALVQEVPPACLRQSARKTPF